MKKLIKKVKGKKVLSMLLALIMVLTVANPAISPIMGIIAKAASGFPVELAFDNLFVFDHWVTNGNSMIIDNDFGSVNAGTITDIDFENGSFRFTNNTNHNIYTRAAAGQGEKTEENFDYYRMPVKAGATYTLSFNLTGTVPACYPFVFFYNESNEFTGNLVNGAFSGTGDFSYIFTVPEGASYIQLRLTIAGNETKDAYAIFKDICVSRYDIELDSTNLFDFDAWAANEKSSVPHGYYCDGTVTNDIANKSMTFNTDTSGDVGAVYTGFSIDTATAANNEGYYTIAVEPNTTYTLSYYIVAEGCSLGNFVPYVAEFNSSNLYTNALHGVGATKYEGSSFTFTTGATASHIQLSFSVTHQNQKWTGTVKDIGLYKTTITDHKVDPVRKTYTYNSSNNATYGTLPTPPAETYPEGYIFAGWYTEPDGQGIRIAADTEILPQSMTVYPKFEPAVDTLTVKTPPTKTTYTVGEKINIAGLVITATQTYTVEITDEDGKPTGETEIKTNTFDINSGFYIDPEHAQDTAGTQNVTVHYGGKTATFPITVSAGDDKNIVVNGNSYAVTVANNNYVINYQATEPFNRYEMTYSSDSYVKGEIVMDGVTEEFFLEPSGNGSFASYIDSFLRGVKHYNVDSIKFTCLDNEFGNFELLSLTTIAGTTPSNPTQYYENAETGYKVGIDLGFGGVISEIYDLNNTEIESRVYTIDGKNVTKVDYADILDEQYGANYISRETGLINLINKFDRGRYLQQSYYGTSQKPYELGDYNGQEWPYNPVQGGNLVINNADGTTKGNEASKVIDFRITDKQIYVKTRPLDWGKNSVDYPDSYVTDSYMEAWYVFEDGMIKTYCRFVDFSGYPSHTRDQELPAVYIIEPLNTFVYNNVADGSQWTTANYTKETEPEFWGVLPEYNALLIANGQAAVDPTVDCYENWAAFAASKDASSFGVGVYSAGVTDFHYGCFFPKYNETEAKKGYLVETENRHAVTTIPAEENPTSYISPVGNMTFESYKPIEYSYYITTGNADKIYQDFKSVANKDTQAELDKSKIAVPETVYMTPADGASKIGQYYVNNILDENDSYNIKTEAVRDAEMYLGFYVRDAKAFSVKITNATAPSNDIYLCNSSGSEISENTRIPFGATGTFEDGITYGLRFSGAGLSPGEKATAKWEITVYFDDGTTETYTAYTVMYAPQRTVGAVAEGRQSQNGRNEISSWITGANGVNHSQESPLGSFSGDLSASGYFIDDPLCNEAPPTYSTVSTTDDLINVATVDNEKYVMQTAQNNTYGSSRSHSYLGLLTVDGSRYTNTNQIPNLEIGFDALRIGGYTKDSMNTYNSYYTLGTSESFTSTDLEAVPIGWSEIDYIEGDSNNSNFADHFPIPYRDSVTPSYAVSDIDGKYIHALNRAQCIQDYTLYISRRYSTAATSVFCSVTDKSGLRDAVLEGYTLTNTNSTFDEALQEAGTVLGDPSATQTEIDNAKDALNNAKETLVETFYALKYDNLFSAYEYYQHSDSMTVVSDRGTATYSNGTITVVNGTITDGEAYTNYGSGDGYYKVDLKPNTEYVFEYDVTTDVKAQAFMFFYNASGDAGDVPTNMSIKVDDGNWGPKSESKTWWGNYTEVAGTYHYAIKFTTGANTAKAAFRFGNTTNDPCTSTFSNIRLIDAAHYYENVEYTKTEDVYKEYATYGTLPTLDRTGYTFEGWVDENGNAVTGAEIATAHKTIYSDWTAYYTINYSKNGPEDATGSFESGKTYYEDKQFALPGALTWAHGDFLGWSTDQYATTAEYTEGQTINVSDIVDKANADHVINFHAVWRLKDSVAVEDKVVADFGLPVTLHPFDNDSAVFANYHMDDTNMCSSYEVAFTDSANDDSDSGTFSYNKAEKTVTYTPTKVLQGVDKVNMEVTLKYAKGDTNTITSTITVAPASNVYYEETVMTDLSYSNRINWSVAESEKNTPEASGRDEVYGYDDRYNVIDDYSNGKGFYVKTSADAKLSQAKTFNFTGTGFDLVSACGPTTGVLLVNIKQGTAIKKVLIVDTYCADSFNQVPVVAWSDAYSAYTVEVTATYLTTAGALKTGSVKNNLIDTGLVMNTAKPNGNYNVTDILAEAGIENVDADKIELVWFDDNSVLNGGTGASRSAKASRDNTTDTQVTSLDNYIDGIRVYNPLGSNASGYSETEKNPIYANVINALADLEASGNITGDLTGIAYIDEAIVGDSTVTFATYKAKGPKDEIYLGKNQAISFALALSPNERVMLGLRAVNGSTKFTIASVDGVTIQNIEVNSATEMYYDITNCLSDTVKTQGGVPTIVITNSEGGMLAVNHIKCSGLEAANGLFPSVSVRSSSRSANNEDPVIQNKFQPLNEESLIGIQECLGSENAVQGEVVGGVVMPINEDEGNEPNTPEGNEPNIPDDGGNEGGDDSSSTNAPFDIFSLLKLLIEFIKYILFNTVGNAQLV